MRSKTSPHVVNGLEEGGHVTINPAPGDTSEDHVGHIMANCGMLAYFEKSRPELDDRR